MTGGDGFRPFLLEKMAITKQKKKNMWEGRENRRDRYGEKREGKGRLEQTWGLFCRG